MFINYTYYDSTSCEHIYHTVLFNRKDQLCFIVAAYFPLQVLILAFVEVNMLPLKMLYKVCVKILPNCWSQGEHSHLLSVGITCSGLLHHHENQMSGDPFQWNLGEGAGGGGSQGLMRNNANSWPTLF